jgi:hypothetical protein
MVSTDEHRTTRAREALTEQATAQARAMPHLSRPELRQKFKAAHYGDSAKLVFDKLTLAAGEDNSLVRITWDELGARCYDMSRKTLDRSLEHLERHGWLTRAPGRPTRYELHEGEPCRCKPGRGQASTSTERMRRRRAKLRDEAADVTATDTLDVTATDTLGVTETDTHDVTGNGTVELPDVTALGVTNRRSDAVFPVIGTDPSQEPTEVPPSATSKDEPSEPETASSLRCGQGAALDPPGDADPLDPGRAEEPTRRRRADTHHVVDDLQNVRGVEPADLAGSIPLGPVRGGHEPRTQPRPTFTGQDHPQSVVTEVEGGPAGCAHVNQFSGRFGAFCLNCRLPVGGWFVGDPVTADALFWRAVTDHVGVLDDLRSGETVTGQRAAARAAKRAEVLRLADEGVSRREISALTGVPLSWVGRWIIAYAGWHQQAEER